MMPEQADGRAAVALALALALSAALAGWWRTQVFRSHGAEPKAEPWTRIKEDYPPVVDRADAALLPLETVEAVLRANPFSPERRAVQAAPATGASGDTPEGAEPAGPQLVYKGRINLGQRRRAIIEDVHAHKTYFLEVGQEVAGFKVLDIVENRVVLSDLKTQEEVVVALTTTAGP